MVNQPKRDTKIRNLIILAIAFLIVSTITIIIIFINSRSHLSITNFGNYAKTATNSEKKSLGDMTWNLITNTIDIDKNTYITATIRDDSYKENRYNNTLTAKFLLDVDAIKRTYSIEFSWSRVDEVTDGVIVNCPKRQDSKYGNEDCVGMYNDFSSTDLYLPYKSTLSNNRNIEASEDWDLITGEYHINIYVDSCGFDKYEEEAEEKTKNYFKESGLNVDDYKFEIIDVCTTYRSTLE